jgi:hypothetical protein
LHIRNKPKRRRVYLNRKPYLVIPLRDVTDAKGEPCDVVRDDVQRVVWVEQSLTCDERDQAVFLLGLDAALPPPE